MNDETQTPEPASLEQVLAARPVKKAKAPKKNFYKDKADKLQAQVADLQSQLKTQAAVKEHFDKAPEFHKIEGFKDENDRAEEKHREMIADAKIHGINPEEVIEYQLDRSEVRALGYKGKEWIKANRLKWVNRVSRDGSRVATHEGKGFFIVKPDDHPVKPTHGIKKEDSWWNGDLILMAETTDFFERAMQNRMRRMKAQGVDAREGTREQINQLIRDESGQPNARPGITKSYRDNTWERVEEGAAIQGPSAHNIPA